MESNKEFLGLPICRYYVEGSSIIVEKPDHVTGQYKCKIPFLEKAYTVFSPDALIDYHPTGIVVVIPRTKDTVKLEIKKEYKKEILDLEGVKEIKVLDLDTETVYGLYKTKVQPGYYIIPNFQDVSTIYIGEEEYPVFSSIFIPTPSDLKLALKESISPYKFHDYFCIGKECKEVVFALGDCPPNDIVIKFGDKYYNIVTSYTHEEVCMVYASIGDPIYYNPNITDFGVGKYLQENIGVLACGIGFLLALFILLYMIYRMITKTSKKQKKIISMK